MIYATHALLATLILFVFDTGLRLLSSLNNRTTIKDFFVDFFHSPHDDGNTTGEREKEVETECETNREKRNSF